MEEKAVNKRGKRACVALMLLLLSTALLMLTIFPQVFAETKLSGKKVIIISGWCAFFGFDDLANLIMGEGAEVVARCTPGNLPLQFILEETDVFIIDDDGYFGFEPYSAVFDFARSAKKGLLILSPVTALLAFAGVVPDPIGMYEWNGTSRATEHPINEGVRIIAGGIPLKLVSSEAYPLAAGEGVDKLGIRRAFPTAVASTAATRIVAVGQYGFDLTAQDNALFVKNALYWLAGVDVPPYPRELPTLLSLEDEAKALEAKLALLSERLEAFTARLENMPEFASLKEQLLDTTETLDDVEKALVQMQQENTALKQRLSQVQQQLTRSETTWMFIAPLTAFSVILAIAAVAVSLRRRKV